MESCVFVVVDKAGRSYRRSEPDEAPGEKIIGWIVPYPDGCFISGFGFRVPRARLSDMETAERTLRRSYVSLAS